MENKKHITALQWLLNAYVKRGKVLMSMDVADALEMERKQIEQAYNANKQCDEKASDYYETLYGKP